MQNPQESSNPSLKTNDTEPEEIKPNLIDRRTLVKAAWAAPAVLAFGTLPSMAAMASGDGDDDSDDDNDNDDDDKNP